MTTLLHIDSSAQGDDRSITRRLGALFRDEWLGAAPENVVIHRDLARVPVPPVDAGWIAAAFTPPPDRTAAMQAALALSDALIDELERADVIALGAPMYNYGMPAALKAWFDQIARIGRTFSFDLARGDTPIEPLLSGRKLVVLSSRGEFGFAPGGMRAHLNALDPAVAACAHYLGADRNDIHTVAVEYQEFKDDRHRRSFADAERRTIALARDLGGARLGQAA